MAGFVFTTAEIGEVRLQMGKGLRFSDLETSEINSPTIRDSACDYVVQSVTKGITTAALDAAVASGSLTQAEADAFGKVRDETATDITHFINLALRPPQVGQFRRSIVYRASGLSVALLTRLQRERADVIEQTWEERGWREHQAYLFQQCDDEIRRLRDAFPNDLFRVRPAQLTLLAVTGG